MPLISSKHLPRDLRIIGVLAFLFALLQIGRITQASIFLVLFIIYLSSGIILFSLAAGVSKKEKWAWIAGVIIFSISIISGIVSFLLRWVSPISFIISLLLPVLFLITFLREKKEIAIFSSLSVVPFIFWIIGFILNLVARGYLFYLISSSL